MTDPYKVLQVSPNASDEEVKTAYRELARKYHPDNFNGNPLSDLATEKMQEINDAYDRIMEMRRGSRDSGGSYSQGQDGARPSQFADIRRLINSRRITEAEELLDGVPHNRRDAEWHFLKGTVQQFRGWLDDAYNSYATACNLDPGNAEYKNAFSQLEWQRRNGQPRYRGYSAAPISGGCTVCDACAALYCMNCLCNCLGGGGC